MRRRAVAVAAAVLVALATGGATIVWACTPSSGLSPISPAAGAAGSRFTVAGRAFQAAGVEIHWGAADGPLVATATGPSFSVPVTVPAVAPGVYLVVATQPGSTNPAETFEVTAPAEPPAAPASERAPAPPGPAVASPAAPTPLPGPAPGQAAQAPAPAVPVAAPAPAGQAVPPPPDRPARVSARPAVSPSAAPASRAAAAIPPSTAAPAGPPAPAPAADGPGATPPSPRSAAAELWSGFASSGDTGRPAPGLITGPPSRGHAADGITAGLVLATAGLLAMAFVVAVPALRRRRAPAGHGEAG